MSRRPSLLVMALAVALPSAAGADGIGFQYTIERQRGDSVSQATFLRGFDAGDSFSLRVKLQQASYCYVLMGEPGGKIRLTLPEGSRKADPLRANEWARMPKTTFAAAVADDQGVERMYLVVASQRIPELEQAYSAGATQRESFALDVRDRYHAEGSYSRDIDGDTVTVKYKPKKASTASVVVEEISLRARRR